MKDHFRKLLDLMQKMQILFPDPLMARLRQNAQRIDTTVSDLVRRATEEWLSKMTYVEDWGTRPSVDALLFHGGRVIADDREMKSAIYDGQGDPS